MALEPVDGDRIALIQAFVESARLLNFAAAAQSLALTPSTLGRRVKRLEKRLGVDLLTRSTRRVSLTEAGEIYLPLCEDILQSLDEADAMASSLGGSPAGLLRVTAPATFSRLHLSEALPRFLKRYPEIRLDIRYSDAFVDIVEERIDVAIRIGELADSSLKSRLLTQNIRRLVAAPSYLESMPALRKPRDLEQHRLLHFSRLSAGEGWPLQKDGVVERVAIQPWLRSDDAYALFHAALAGLGVALLADFITAPALKDGALVPVLNDWEVPRTGIYALYAGDTLPQKSRVFIDFLVETMNP